MQFENDKKTCKFEVPDKPTVRQQLLYVGAASGTIDGNFLLRLWGGAKQIITKWECEFFPDFMVDLADVTDSRVTDVVLWASIEVQKHMNNLEDIPKN